MKSLFGLEVLKDFSSASPELPGVEGRQYLATGCELRWKACGGQVVW